ncbi:hypothetical protein [Pseudonocardia sp. TRM90224]|uniref:hypothetical protein n=1 Tax=Pseudonocardia sp. TRM90224 TaxID=2812678 RepID=UPI001E49DCEC|nr:hypothetical protein [Pseudonocardia sp. TRM90224]
MTPEIVPCTTAQLRRRLELLTDHRMAFLGRDTRTDPVAMIEDWFRYVRARLFTAGDGLFGVVPNELNPHQAEIDIAVPGASAAEYTALLGAAIRLCRTHLDLHSVVRIEPNRDGRAAHLEPAGLRPIGVLHGCRFQDGDYHDQRLWWGQTA